VKPQLAGGSRSLQTDACFCTLKLSRANRAAVMFTAPSRLLCPQRAAALPSLPGGRPQRLRLPLRPPVLAAALRRELPSPALPPGALREQYVCVCVCVCVCVSRHTLSSLSDKQLFTCCLPGRDTHSFTRGRHMENGVAE